MEKRYFVRSFHHASKFSLFIKIILKGWQPNLLLRNVICLRGRSRRIFTVEILMCLYEVFPHIIPLWHWSCGRTDQAQFRWLPLCKRKLFFPSITITSISTLHFLPTAMSMAVNLICLHSEQQPWYIPKAHPFSSLNCSTCRSSQECTVFHISTCTMPACHQAFILKTYKQGIKWQLFYTFGSRCNRMVEHISRAFRRMYPPVIYEPGTIQT
jgi:hypothetical protein